MSSNPLVARVAWSPYRMRRSRAITAARQLDVLAQMIGAPVLARSANAASMREIYSCVPLLMV
jgi:hypothetical protein